ncbi:MAG: hypothetical protein MRY79_08460 [Alphaproteobacteria bacterium]|nr:hypothetical protein [Alphaproteobacteria bacterium]
MIKKNENLISREKGSAIIWILIAVGLFAALAFAFQSSNRTSTSMLSDEEATAYANQIIQYGNEVKAAVKRLTLRGCDETEISFENNIVSGYTNANAPASKKCHVFDIKGGGLDYKQINEKWLNSNLSGSQLYNEWVNSGVPALAFVGKDNCGGGSSSCSDLSLFLPYVSQTICTKINDVLEVTNPAGDPYDEGTGICLSNSNKFKGTYSTGTCGIDGDPVINGKKSACIKTRIGAASTEGYLFFTALIPR